MEPYSKRSNVEKKDSKSPYGHTLPRRRDRIRAAAAAARVAALAAEAVPVQVLRTGRHRWFMAVLAVALVSMGIIRFVTFASAQEGTPSPLSSPSPIGTASPAATVPIKPKAPPATTLDGVTPGVSLAIVFALTLLSGAFSMSETALVSVRRTRVEQLVEEGRRGAQAVRDLVENPPRFIATVQIGITLLGFASAAAAATTLSAPFVPIFDRIPGISHGAATATAVIFVTLLVSLLTMVVGEIAPKSIAIQAPDVWALRLAPFVRFCSFIFAPLTSVVIGLSNLIVRPFGAKAKFSTPMITREEFEQIIDQGEQHGEIDDEEAKIITNVFDLSETAIRAVMTPRIDMTALPLDADLDRTLDTILLSGHSRIPVYESTIDNIAGIVHAKDLLQFFKDGRKDVELRKVMRAPYFVPETKTVAELLEELRRSNQQLAIVQDEYAGTAGIVTIEDLVEQIVGEIRDEYDVDEPDVQVISDTESLIDGRMGILDVNDRLGIDLSNEEYDTIGGLVFGLLGHEPLPGDRVRQDGLEFLVEHVEGRRIRTIRAVKVGSVAAATGAEPEG